MFLYRIEDYQDDGNRSVQEFWSFNDSDAISRGLSVRTSNRCELYQGDRWLATFDGAVDANDVSTNGDRTRNRSLAEPETEVAYFRRRALRERELSRSGLGAASKLAHLASAENLESLARTAEATRRRLSFYDVNAFQGEKHGRVTTRPFL